MPGSSASSHLFQPLDSILGRVSHVRVLRVLGLHGGGLAPTELARRAGLSRRGAWNALEALEAVGVVEPVGTGHSVPFRLNPDHPLGEVIQALFESEAGRADAVLASIRSVAESLDPGPAALWLFGSAARGEDEPGSDLDVAVVGRTDAEARASASQLRDALVPIGERWGVHPSVISLSRAELARLQRDEAVFWRRLTEEAIPLTGLPPDRFNAYTE